MTRRLVSISLRVFQNSWDGIAAGQVNAPPSFTLSLSLSLPDVQHEIRQTVKPGPSCTGNTPQLISVYVILLGSTYLQAGYGQLFPYVFLSN